MDWKDVLSLLYVASYDTIMMMMMMYTALERKVCWGFVFIDQQTLMLLPSFCGLLKPL